MINIVMTTNDETVQHYFIPKDCKSILLLFNLDWYRFLVENLRYCLHDGAYVHGILFQHRNVFFSSMKLLFFSEINQY